MISSVLLYVCLILLDQTVVIVVFSAAAVATTQYIKVKVTIEAGLRCLNNSSKTNYVILSSF